VTNSLAYSSEERRRYDIQHNDIQHYDTQHNAEHCYSECPVMLRVIYAGCHIQALQAECRYAKCLVCFTVTLSVIMLNVVMLSVVAPERLLR
jgi:hypothetical protein